MNTLNKKILGIIFCLLLVLLVFHVSATLNYRIYAKEKNNDGTLSGYVNDTSMNPIEGALVRVHFHGTYEEDYTDSSGYYHVTNIPICYCMKNCTASKEGYQTEWVLMGIVEDSKHDYILEPQDVIPVLNGSQCGGWWNSPVTISFIFNPEIVKEIWIGNILYTEPFVFDENGTYDFEYYWINYLGNETYEHFLINIDQIEPDTNIDWEAFRKIPFGNWYVKITINAEDTISGMSPFLEFYINDALQDELEVSWPEFEMELGVKDIIKNSKLGFYCYDNANNLAIEELNGSDITSCSMNQYINIYKIIYPIINKISEKFLLLNWFNK